MASSRRSAISQTGPRGNTRSHPSLRANNTNNYPRHQFQQANVLNRHDFSDHNAAMPMHLFPMPPPAPGPAGLPYNITKLDRFLNSVTPIVAAKKPPQWGVPYYFLEDLWEAFQEWSAYGAGVPYVLNDGNEITQYYVPYLSGMQIYIDPRNPPFINGDQSKGKGVQSHGPDQQTSLAGSLASLNLNNQKGKQVASSSDNVTQVCGPCGLLAYEYMEHKRPHLREPLSLKVSLLGNEFPNLSKYRSCDLLPSSWIAVAWYPIYRIPAGTMLEDLDACFLTLHTLSTQHGSFIDPMVADDKVKIRLPAIGLVTYKLRGSKISPYGPYECGQEEALFRSACNWLNSVGACLPDHDFFFRRY